MKKYTIEFSNKYAHLALGDITINADSPENALETFLKEKGLYFELEQAGFSKADVSIKTGKENVFYKLIDKEPMLKSRPNAVEQKEMYEVQKLLKKGEFSVYHGTKDPDLKPDFSFNNCNNDYGKGFYTTPYPELGKEWAFAAYTKGEKGYLYEYKIDVRDLNVLDLTQMDSMHWVAELIANRNINTDNREALKDTIEAFKKKYKLDTTKYDVIIGYRADDSYFTYVEDFLAGNIYRETLEAALRNGNLGIQVFIKSKKAFELLQQVGDDPEEVPVEYKVNYEKRDKAARKKYLEDRKNQVSRTKVRVFDLL